MNKLGITTLLLCGAAFAAPPTQEEMEQFGAAAAAATRNVEPHETKLTYRMQILLARASHEDFGLSDADWHKLIDISRKETKRQQTEGDPICPFVRKHPDAERIAAHFEFVNQQEEERWGRYLAQLERQMSAEGFAHIEQLLDTTIIENIQSNETDYTLIASTAGTAFVHMAQYSCEVKDSPINKEVQP
jgi:hypothetical protein